MNILTRKFLIGYPFDDQVFPDKKKKTLFIEKKKYYSLFLYMRIYIICH
jgi:hypothetical protein